MAKYKITFKKSVAKDLRVIPKNDIKKILGKIDILSENPRGEGCIKLSGKEIYRVRQGLYRIIYEIKDGLLIVNVVKVAHRSHVYKSN
ncbi:type II toxin-antitoxin system RelE family toxin [Moritella yayanosii]|uniref:Type II toxin-antitoxin system mRNA interferase toxin, RelE/StbE family n=1 Tax=Moritella yayanosii TaxID=69539 RepID=A0A330LIU6_9GAMM|nr:type II toxin-antitoxin system RelE/ParE family toxin [Moritella yayanosii]SQD76519.1 Type II toxin-antitoxin system mRNA interferase toxin, RelE/StbE family [Moritella yayanosii]